MPTAVRTTYRGYTLVIEHADILAIAPNGDTACYPGMQTIRRWVRDHAREAGANDGPSPPSAAPALRAST